MLTHALEFAFTGLLGPKRYPIGVLKIVLDPEQVDVNVHPAKAEVRFHREQEVHAAVAHAVKSALSGVSMVQELAMGSATPSRFARATSFPTTGMTSTSSSPILPRLEPEIPSPSAPPLAQVPPVVPVSAPASQRGLRAIGQFHGIFLLAESRDALLVLNQHRAHERILFDRLWNNYSHVATQRLILPGTLHLGHREAATLDANLGILAGFGFEIEPLSGQSYLVRAVPAVLASQNPETMIQGILADLDAGISIAQFTCDDPAEMAMQEGRRRLLASIACKAAIKAGRMLASQEQQQLLDDLQETTQPSLCPHGGPIIMTISEYELDKKFLR
jgi:DNA mismatch repair protein MutL